jgi:gamma-glutamyltranspeptidase/glutathione hydrolase
LALAGCGGGDPPATATTPTPGVSATATGYAKGVVAVSNPLAAKVGADILAAGGNAIDAAVAIQFALNAVEPQSSGIGGGGFMMVHLAKENKTFYIDAREKAPAAATPTMFGSLNFEPASTSGIAVGVPGTLRGVTTALRNWGTMKLADTLAPAITLAESGFPVGTLLAADIKDTDDRGFVMTDLQPETAAIFRPGGVPLAKGSVLKQPDLAKTFKLIAAQGPDVFYKGEIATAIAAAQTRTTTSKTATEPLLAGGGAAGTMTVADLTAYDVAIRQPLVGTYRGYTVKTMPPPSGGGITVLQQLKMLEQFPIGDATKGYAFGDKNTLHVLIEGMRLSFVDRNFWEGDGDFVKVPTTGLLDSTYLAARGALIKVATALGVANIVPGNPLPRDKPAAATTATGAADPREGAHTTHFVVADKDNNIVSYTTTVESLFGSGITVPGYGFLLNNQMTDFNWPPTVNAATGDIGANDVAPFKRPRSSMTPTLLLKDGTPFAAIGSAGGSKIINAIVQVTSNVIDHGMGIQAAIDAPRISARAGGTVFCETGPFAQTGFTPTPAFSAANVAAVSAMREAAINMPACSGNSANGANLSAQGLVIDLNTGLKYGAADKRREGTVLGIN